MDDREEDRLFDVSEMLVSHLQGLARKNERYDPRTKRPELARKYLLSQVADLRALADLAERKLNE